MRCAPARWRRSPPRPTTSRAGSSDSACATRRRITTESSTTSTRMRAPGGIVFLEMTARIMPHRKSNLPLDQPQHPQLVRQDLLGERLHHIFIGARGQRLYHLVDLRFGGHHHYFHGCVARIGAQSARATRVRSCAACSNPPERARCPRAAAPALRRHRRRRKPRNPAPTRFLDRIMRTARESSTTMAWDIQILSRSISDVWGAGFSA